MTKQSDRWLENILIYYAKKYSPERKWDRVYVTTLFTFYWKKTLNAIKFAKRVSKSIEGVYVGGIAASLIPELISRETGLSIGGNIIKGLLDKPGILDDNNIIIEQITPDYSILDTVNYHYSLDTGYLAYMTRGCTRGTCPFCAVPRLEPVYKEKISIKKQIQTVAKIYGERKDLILLDNNVLGSPRFSEIIQEIMEMGFVKGAQFVEPNHFWVLTEYLVQGDSEYNEGQFLQKLFFLLNEFGNDRIRDEDIRQEYYQLLRNHGLNTWNTFSKENILNHRKAINEYIEKYRNRAKKLRYVDFNQGLDCRYLDEEKMKMLSQLPIRPMRIAFDYLSLREQYERAIRLADSYGVRKLSNYILFNYKDKPKELWQRLKINIDLNRELQAEIYSFPMKYLPICEKEGEDPTDRSFVGEHWNRKYLRAIGCILNASGGVVTVSSSFFDAAFGETLEDFFKILLMPEPYIRYRNHFKNTGSTDLWWGQWNNLSETERKQVLPIIYSNDFSSFVGSSNRSINQFMQHYLIRYRPER